MKGKVDASMDNQNKNGNLKYIDECFLNIKSNIDVHENLESIKRSLNREFSNFICSEIEIVPTIRTDHFFGMRVYPIQNSLNIITNILVDFLNEPSKLTKENLEDHMNKYFNALKINQKIEYIIEIDNRIITDKAMGINPEELTAVLLHEIGHIVYDFNENIKRICYNFSLTLIKYNTYLSFLPKMKIKGNRYLLYLYIINSFTNMGYGIKYEKKADSFAVINGYGNELISVLNKMLNNGLHSSNIDKKSKDVYADDDRFAKWTIQTLINLEKRQRDIIRDIGVQKNMEKSSYLQIIYDKIIDDLKINRTSAYNQEVVEEAYNEIIQEGLNIFNKPKVRQRDIDEIQIDIEAMQDYDDKIVILNKIHKRLEQVEASMIKFEEDKKMIDILTTYQNQLKELLDKLLNTKVVEKQYGVFIKYPKGYEG
jgi:hypothetical protein